MNALRNRCTRYHAHVYFDTHTEARARALCDGAAARFAVKVGRMHRTPVGPHPRGSCQLAFDASVFDALIAWLERHRGNLTVLVHGITGDDLADHTTHAMWLGPPERLDLSRLRS